MYYNIIIPHECQFVKAHAVIKIFCNKKEHLEQWL